MIAVGTVLLWLVVPETRVPVPPTPATLYVFPFRAAVEAAWISSRVFE